MAAPYKDKPLLEMSDREVEARRLADLERSGRDAIEGFYPEEVLVPAAKALKGVGSKIAKQVDLAMRPKVENTLVPDLIKSRVGKGTYAVRNVNSPLEIENIKKSGYMLPSPKELESGRNRKWFTQTDNPNKNTLRVRSENVPPNRAVRRKDVEIYNKETGEYEPLKKGGAVKSKAFRGDGIVQRGKTKGRMI